MKQGKTIAHKCNRPKLNPAELQALKFLGVDSLAVYIDRSPAAIRNLVLRRAIPFFKPAGRLLFEREKIDAWVKQSEGVSLEEILNEQ